MVETIGVTAVIAVLCAISYFIGTYVGFSVSLDKAIKAESQRLRSIYAEQENEDG